MWIQSIRLLGALIHVCRRRHVSCISPILPMCFSPPPSSKPEMSFPSPLGGNPTPMTEQLTCPSAEHRAHPPPRVSPDEACAPCSPPRSRYLVAAGAPLGRLQAAVQTEDTHFGSSLGGKPVALHKIHDHHMVFQLCAEGFDLEGPAPGGFRVAGGGPKRTGPCRSPRVLHDTRNLVTPARQPGRHNFLCFTQALSAAGGTGEVAPVFSSSQLLVPMPRRPRMQVCARGSPG